MTPVRSQARDLLKSAHEGRDDSIGVPAVSRGPFKQNLAEVEEQKPPSSSVPGDERMQHPLPAHHEESARSA